MKNNRRKKFLLLTFLLLLSLIVTSCGQNTPVENTAIPNSTSVITNDSRSFQSGNHNPVNSLYLKNPNNLKDTRIGALVSYCIKNSANDWSDWINSLKADGFTRTRFTLNASDGPNIVPTYASIEKEIPVEYIALYKRMKQIGIISRYSLTFWDLENRNNSGNINYERLNNEEEILRYLDYVDMVTTSLSGFVSEYEMWNEPDANRDFYQRIEPDDYIAVANRVIPLIRENDPEAKIVLASTSSYTEPECQEYTMQILQSDLPAQADVISLHTVNNDASPVFLSDYYYGYEEMWQEIKSIAEAHGFRGEYAADELNYRSTYSLTELQPETGLYHPYEPEVAAKYIGRMIAINLGMDISVGTSGTNAVERPCEGKMIRNMAYLLEGWQATPIQVDITSDSDLIRYYTFADRDGNIMLAIWNDAEAKVNSDTVESTIILKGIEVENITGSDPFQGLIQKIQFKNNDDDVVISGVFVKDYPILYQINTLE